MKPTKLVILFLLLSVLTFGQSKLPMDSTTKLVAFKSIINLDSAYKADVIYSIVKEWFSTNNKEFNRTNENKNPDIRILHTGLQSANAAQVDLLFKNDHPLKYEDTESKKLVGKGVLKYSGGSGGCVRILYIEFDIKVLIKDFKLKMDMTNFNYTHYIQTTITQSQLYGFNDRGPCNSKNTIEKLTECNHCEDELEALFSYLVDDMNTMMEDLKIYLKNNKKQEKW